MGRSYKYLCLNCGYENTLLTGAGFLTSQDYFDEEEKYETDFIKGAYEGKYGDLIKTILEHDNDNHFLFSCSEKIYQCGICCNLLVKREKRISKSPYGSEPYSMQIDIKQECPDCGRLTMEEVGTNKPRCPKCKNSYLLLKNSGMWD